MCFSPGHSAGLLSLLGATGVIKVDERWAQRETVSGGDVENWVPAPRGGRSEPDLLALGAAPWGLPKVLHSSQVLG